MTIDNWPNRVWSHRLTKRYGEPAKEWFPRRMHMKCKWCRKVIYKRKDTGKFARLGVPYSDESVLCAGNLFTPHSHVPEGEK